MLLRLVRAGVHVAAGCAASGLLYPLLPAAARETIRRRWSRRLLAILGVRLRAPERAPANAALLVANHVSWLDVVALEAIAPSVFVCKAEVRRWPVLGWLVARQRTVFLERGRARAAARAAAELAARLAAGERVAVFPEGTTGDGAAVLAFRPALFEAAIASGAPVQPVAISYSAPEARFVGETTLWESMRAVAGARALEVRLEFCAPIASVGADRRALAERARRAIQARLAGGRSLPAAAGAKATGSAGSGSAAGTIPSSAGPTCASAATVSRA